ncbi:PI-PLC X domain-containing protein 1-like [Arapaima gigas]
MAANEHWMARLPAELWAIPLSALAIPGSHDTMTYCLDLQSPVVPSQPLVLRLLDCVAPCVTRPCLYKWGCTQMQSITEQLDAGIRYFDLRVAHRNCDSPSVLYFAHGIYTLSTVMDALKEVCCWLNCHTKEVVILACSMFDGLSTDDHKQLIHFIINLFGKKICPVKVRNGLLSAGLEQKVAIDHVLCQMTPSLKSMWEMGYQVIISYDHRAASTKLWPKIPYWWADEVDPQKVILFLDQCKQNGRPEGFFVAGLNLTEDTKYILTHPHQSMHSLTLENYTTFLKWVEKQQPGLGKSCLNIICGDFVGMNSFASIVIDLNQKLLGSLQKN